MKLKEMPFTEVQGEVKAFLVQGEVKAFLVQGEEMKFAFKTVRDQVIFTNKRIIVVNVQGLIGKKVAYFSYPYSKVQFWGVETSGVLDIDCELKLLFSNGTSLMLDFSTKVNITSLNALISSYVL